MVIRIEAVVDTHVIGPLLLDISLIVIGIVDLVIRLSVSELNADLSGAGIASSGAS